MPYMDPMGLGKGMLNILMNIFLLLQGQTINMYI